ncbi:hypothetical protein [Streptomyces griseoaurantiacus]|uniref:hypothetical protein n=1 Tax=Streptomyces griseoaurantiacus TaxID=68213 RepID=UPI0036B3DE26
MNASVPVHLLHDYQGSCWWCGSIADSREHRYKKSDVIRNFKKDRWREGVVRVKGGSERQEYIQGANSGKLKFAKVLCARCNNERSQEFDRAYDVFAEYLHENEDIVVAAGEIRLAAIFGANWRDRMTDVVKYFVKHACCRMAEDKVLIPAGIVDFLNGARLDLPHLAMEMSINLTVYDLTKHEMEVHGVQGGSLWSGPHQVQLNSSGTSIDSVSSHVGINCYFLGYACDMRSVAGGLAVNGERLILPRYRPEGLEHVVIRDVCRDCNPQDPAQADIDR